VREPFNIEDFVAAGYFIGMPGVTVEGHGREKQVTAAGAHFPNLTRHLTGETAPQPALDRAFGMDPNRAAELRNWLQRQEGIWIGWDDVCFSAEVALDLAGRFLDPQCGAVVLGLACPRVLVKSFLAVTEAGEKARPEPGVRVMLKSEAQMEPGGVPLGFEMLELQCRRLVGRRKEQDPAEPERNEYGLFPGPADTGGPQLGATGNGFPMLLLRYA